MPNFNNEQLSFVKKVWIVAGVLTLIVTVALIFEATFDIFILILAGALLACYFRGIGNFIQRKTDWNTKLSLLLSVVGTIVVFAGLAYLSGTTVSGQLNDLKASFPKMLDQAKASLNNNSLGRELVGHINSIDLSSNVEEFLSTFFESTFGGLGQIYVILIVGAFFTISPQIYTNGILSLIPKAGKSKGKSVLNELDVGLKNWLLGKFIAMAAVFVLTALGLIVLGIPMWLTLALIAGLLNFIPNFGPLAAMIPAGLVALSISPTMALVVLGLYLLVQLIESSVITPKAQERLIKMPPALIILAQVFLGSLSGVWGVIFATPLLFIVMVIVKKLYVNPMKVENYQPATDTKNEGP